LYDSLDYTAPHLVPPFGLSRTDRTLAGNAGGPDSINNILALAFGLLIVFVVVACSMWIMADLNDNMLMPSADPMDRAMATRVFRSELVSRRFLA
jgi:hypothetical protein